MFASIGAMGGHDSAFDARKGLEASFAGGVLYTGVLSRKPKSFSIFENTASLTDYQTPQRTLQYLDSANLSMSRTPSQRTTLTFDVDNIFGNDAIRIRELGGTSGSGESASFGIHPGRVFDNQATVRLSRQSTETRSWSASIRNNFRDFIDDHSRVNTLHGRVEVLSQPSPRVGIGLFEETSIERGIVSCTSQSIGVMYERRFTPSISAEGSAGPAIGSKGCTNRYSANLYGALNARVGRSTTIWASAQRKLNDSEFAALSYETNVQGGWKQRFGQDVWFKAQGGWLGGTVPSQTAPFHGTYISSIIGRRLWDGLTASFSVQHSDWAGVANISPSRTIFTGSIYWSLTREEPTEVYGPMAH